MVAKQLFGTVVATLVGLATLQGCVDSSVEEGVIEQGLHDPPLNVVATATGLDRITVSWDLPPTGAKFYVYESADGGAFGYVGTQHYPGTSFVVANRLADTTYCYQVVTDGPEGPSAPSAPAACVTLDATVGPPPPETVTATATAENRIEVSWSAVAGANRYYVHQSLDPAGPYTFVTTVLAPGTGTPVASLTAETTYCYQVQAVTAEGTSPMSAPACDTTFGAGIEGVWMLEEGSGSSAADTSGWGRDGSLTGNTTFTTDRAPMDDNRFALAFGGGTGDAVSIPDQAVFRLAGSFTITLWVKLDAAPSATLRLIGKRAAGCGMTNWELAQDATSGLHLRGANVASFGSSLPVGTWTHVVVTQSGGTARLYLDGVEVGSAAFTIGARNTSALEIGNSGACGSAPALIDHVSLFTRALEAAEIAELGTRPAAPANLVATAESATRVNLSWDPVPGATKYLIYKGTTSGDQVFLTTVLAPTVTFSDAANQPSTQTSWVVRSVQNKMISESSNEQIVTTLAGPAAPTNVTATAVSANRIQVTWDPVADATKYYIYESAAGGPFAFRGTVLGTSPTVFSPADLTADTEYTYYVVSTDGEVTSAPSATASATTFP